MNNTVKRISFNPKGSIDELYIDFPGGSVSVARTSDGACWAHIARDRAENVGERNCGVITGTRIDCEGLDSKSVDKGDIERNDLYHVAVKIVA